ncbi:MAG: hypothetical protein A2Z18_04065, partial [Armatimonadetes bacterium RBG_16_58_9]
MIDFRYHIYSLAAVFLALALGIVLGNSFARNYPSSETSRSTIRRYQQDMRSLRSEIEKAARDAEKNQALAKRNQDFCGAVLPIVVKDKLAGRNVAIIRTGDYGEIEGSIRQVVEAAGAQVTSVTVMSRAFPFDDNHRIAQALVDSGLPPVEEGVKARDKLFRVIAETVCSATHAYALPKLEEAGVAQFSGDYRRYNRLVVLVGGAKLKRLNAAEELDAHLIEQFDLLGATVVGCEDS